MQLAALVLLDQEDRDLIHQEISKCESKKKLLYVMMTVTEAAPAYLSPKRLFVLMALSSLELRSGKLIARIQRDQRRSFRQFIQEEQDADCESCLKKWACSLDVGVFFTKRYKYYPTMHTM